MKLSILICTMDSRTKEFERLIDSINAQRDEAVVEVHKSGGLSFKSGGPARGAKRQKLLEAAAGEFVVFIDDDDEIPSDYLATILPHLNEKVDCVGHLFACYGYNGNAKKMELACVSNRYSRWAVDQDGYRYVRCPHHLVPVRREHALKAGFDPSVNDGEDHAYSQRLHVLGLLKNEVFIDKVLYTIKHNPHKAPGT